MSGNRITRGVKRVKANESEVFNRVVNRTLYSKKIVMAVMLATIMVGSAFMVTVSSLASSPTTPGLEGWTLHTPPPTAPDWTSGELKGYSEGDVVPVRIILYDGGSHEATVTVGFEWGYGLLPTPELRGYDHVVKYNAADDATVDPSAPYNVVHEPGPGGPFCTDTTKGSIVSQTHVGLVQDGWRIWDEWTVNVNFLGGNSPIDIRAGGLLYMTTETQMGASWFPGASLHVRLMGKGGANDLPINVLSGILTPPVMQLHKFVRPDKGAAGDILQFEVELVNMGQADANLVSLTDYLPSYLLNSVVDYQAGSSVWWDSRGTTIDPFADPIITPTPTGVQLTWDLTGLVAKGTGLQGSDGLTVNHLLFEVKINDVPAGQYTNVVRLAYTDDHNQDIRYEWARAPFCVVYPAIEIEKIRIRDEMPRCAAGLYDSGGLQGQGLGDYITYEITVRNPGSVAMQFEVEDAWLAHDYGNPIWSGTIGPTLPGDPVTTLTRTFTYHVIGSEERAEWDNLFRNTANVKAWDIQGHIVTDSSSYDIDILHPDASITKTADREIASRDPAEMITYTITVKNTGDTRLWYELFDQIDAMPVVSLGTGVLEPLGQVGDTAVWYDHFTPTENTRCGPLVNTATLMAHDVQYHWLKRTADATVGIVTPRIMVEKTALDPVTLLPTDVIGPSQQVIFKTDVWVPETLCATPMWFEETDSLDVQALGDSPIGPPGPVIPAGDVMEATPDYLLPGQHDVDYWLYTLDAADIVVGKVTNWIYIKGWWNNVDPHYIYTQDDVTVTATCTINGFVYDDKDLDATILSLMDADDGPGLPNWIVTLCDEFGVPVPGFLPYVTQGGINPGVLGYYEFVGVLPGKYLVRETVASGWFSTIAPTYSTTTQDTDIFTMAGGDTLRRDFGDAAFGSISGTKWYDWNLDHLWDDSEIGIDGWAITLTGTTIVGPYGPVTHFTGIGPIPPSMDGHGYWEFTGLYPGTYTVTEASPPGWAHIEPPSGQFSVQIADNTQVTCAKFGNVPLTTITGYKYYDKDLDGYWDDGEPALCGWTILLQNNSVEWPSIWRTYDSTTTNANGYYQFTGVKPNPGMYRVSEVKKSSEWIMTTNPVALLINLQKPRDPTTIHGMDLGNAQLARIEGVKFWDFKTHDAWPNGIQDVGEPGLCDWTITLQGWTITGVRVDLVTHTSKGSAIPAIPVGYYNFSVLPGTYWVNETCLREWTPTTPISNMVIVVAYPPSQVKVRVNFGNTLLNFDPELPFVLDKGTNLWSVPLVVTSLTAKSLLSAIGPNGASVTRIDPATGRLLSYMPNFPDALNFPLLPGHGYYVAVKQKVQFTLMGDLASATTTELVKGTNLVGYSSLVTMKASAFLSLVSGCHATSVTYLDAATGKLKSYMPSFPSAMDFDMVSGRAYFLVTDGAGSFTVP